MIDYIYGAFLCTTRGCIVRNSEREAIPDRDGGLGGRFECQTDPDHMSVSTAIPVESGVGHIFCKSATHSGFLPDVF